MLIVTLTAQFRKDAKLMKKRGMDVQKLGAVMKKLEYEEPLDFRSKDHALVGNYVGYRECHIEPDWLLIYKIDSQAKQIAFVRTGTHSDLLGK